MAARNLPSAATDYVPGVGPIVAAERLRQAARPNSMVPLGSENIRAAAADYSGGATVPRAPAWRSDSGLVAVTPKATWEMAVTAVYFTYTAEGLE